MALVPAICRDCGTLFASPNVIGGMPPGGVAIVGSIIRGCPNCGGIGDIPDGIYDFTSDAVSIVTALPGNQLQDLAATIEGLREDPPATEEEAIDRLAATSPELAAAAKRFLTPEVGVLAALLTLLVSIIIMVQGCQAAGEDPKVIVQPTTVIERAVTVPQPKAPQARRQKVGRNAPCPCGSGKKFKRCCGQ